MMRNFSIRIKALALSVLLAVMTISASAQDLSSYFVTGSVARSEHNAAFAPDRGYFNIPLVGALSLSTSGNVSLDKLLFPMNGSLVTIFDTNVSADEALSGLNSNNVLGLSNRLSILGFGSYMKDRTSFWSFDLGLRTSANMSMPYEFFEFFKTAPEYSSFSDVNFSMDSYLEAVFGYSRKLGFVSDKLTVGARFKLLGGLFRTDFNIDQMDVTLTGEEWTAQASGYLDMYANGMTFEEGENESGDKTYEMGSIDGSFSGFSGFGMAVDLGATYDYSDDLRFSLAVNDLGFIKWKEGSNTHGTVANEFTFAGANVDVDSGSVDNAEDSIKIDEIELIEADAHDTVKSLQANINAGAEYGFLDNRIGVGGIYSMRMWESQTLHNFVLAATLRPTSWFSFAANYNISTSSNNTVGLAINFDTKFINLYLATDIIASKKTPQYIPIDQAAMNVSFGLAVPMGRCGERNAWGNKKSKVTGTGI